MTSYRPQIYNPTQGQFQRSPAGSFTEADGIVQPAIAQTLTASTAIAPVASTIAISSATEIALTATPAIAPGIDPNKFQVLTLINIGSNNITLQDESVLTGSGLRLFKNNWVIRPNRSIPLLYRGGMWQQLFDGEALGDADILDAILRVDGDNAGINATTLQGTSSSGFLKTANNLSDLSSRSAARTNLEASSPFWNAGQIRGIDVSPTTPLHKQVLVFNSTTNQYAPAVPISSDEIRGIVLTGLSTSSATPISETDSILSALGKLQAQVNTFNSLPTPQYRYLASDSNNVVDSTSGYNSFQSLVNSGTGGNNSLAQTIKSNQPLFVATSGGMQAHLLIQAGAVRFMAQNSASNLTGSFEIVAALAYSNPAIGDSNEIISFDGNLGAMLGITYNKVRIGRSNVSWDFVGNTIIADNQVFIANFRWENGQQRLRINGIEEGGSAATPIPIFNTAIELGIIGGPAPGDTKIFEIWVFSPALSNPSRVRIENHLTGKYL